MKKKILIIAGGFSREREISLKTAKGVFLEIKKKYKTKICEPDGNLIKNLRAFKPEAEPIKQASSDLPEEEAVSENEEDIEE